MPEGWQRLLQSPALGFRVFQTTFWMIIEVDGCDTGSWKVYAGRTRLTSTRNAESCKQTRTFSRLSLDNHSYSFESSFQNLAFLQIMPGVPRLTRLVTVYYSPSGITLLLNRHCKKWYRPKSMWRPEQCGFAHGITYWINEVINKDSTVKVMTKPSTTIDCRIHLHYISQFTLIYLFTIKLLYIWQLFLCRHDRKIHQFSTTVAQITWHISPNPVLRYNCDTLHILLLLLYFRDNSVSRRLLGTWGLWGFSVSPLWEKTLPFRRSSRRRLQHRAHKPWINRRFRTLNCPIHFDVASYRGVETGTSSISNNFVVQITTTINCILRNVIFRGAQSDNWCSQT